MPACAVIAFAMVPAAPPPVEPLSVAAASDLQPVFQRLADRFERETGRPVTLTFGSSGNFFSQIQNGAPFDLFFSADIDYPRRLDQAGLVERDSVYPYAVGRLVLWARRDAATDVRRGLSALTDPRLHRVAIANPEHAPYGRAAVAALRHEHLYEAVRDKLVLGENIAQAAQFVQSGNADAGLIALATARAPALQASGVAVEIPASFYPPIVQAAAVLRASRHKDAARQFLALLRQPKNVRLLEDAGFLVPSPDAVPDAR